MSAQIYNPNGIIHYTNVDFVERNISVPVHVVKGDDSLPLIDIELLSNGQPYIVPDGADVNFRMRKNDGTYIYNPALGLDSSRTHAYISITAQTAACAGDYEPDLEVVLNSKIAGSSKFKLLVDKSNIEGIESANELKTLYKVAEYAKTVADNIDAVKNVDTNISVIKASPDNALKSEGYSSGTQNGTEVKDGPYYKNNAAYYLSMVKAITESITGLIPLNTSTFEALPPIAEVVIGGMYNISDDFTTTADFEEGTGIKKDAGTNIYKTKGGKWDCLSGNTITKNEFNALALRVTALETLIGDLKNTGVTGDTASAQIKQLNTDLSAINTGLSDKVSGIKGSNESSYRTGNVNISADNIGLGKVNNTADLEKTVYNSTHVNGTQMSFSNISNVVFTQSLSGSQVTTNIEFDSAGIGRILFQIRSTGEIGMYIWDSTVKNWINYWIK